MSDIVERLEATKNGLYWDVARDAIAEITHLNDEVSAAKADLAREITARERADQREKDAEKNRWLFAEGDLVRKKSGSWWEGRVVGTYSTEQTPRGYAVQLDKPNGPVQIYPESALSPCNRRSVKCP